MGFSSSMALRNLQIDDFTVHVNPKRSTAIGRIRFFCKGFYRIHTLLIYTKSYRLVSSAFIRVLYRAVYWTDWVYFTEHMLITKINKLLGEVMCCHICLKLYFFGIIFRGNDMIIWCTNRHTCRPFHHLL